MKFSHALVAVCLVAALPVRAVYAPIPEQEQGKDLTVSVRAGLLYDSNIFGGATGAINSNVYQLAPRLTYNASLTDQTFFSAIYGLGLDYIERRPGTKLLDSHDLTLRLAHAFDQSRILDLTDTYMLARNPESLLNGIPQNTDQSYARNQFDGSYSMPVTPKISLTYKARSANMKYRNASLGRLLDRLENLYGVAGSYAILPELKGVVEYRHLDVYYWTEGENKNKRSDYLMGGVDYEAAKKLTLAARLGSEWRNRANEESTTGPFVEFSGRYRYAEKSVLAGGFAYTIDEASDVARFTDQEVQRYFVSVQHSLTALIVASVSVNYEPAVLQARRALGFVDLNEETTRFGAALTYSPTKNWSISATYDWDHTSSDDPMRATERHRFGLNASYTF
ncbi:outer membrane beta-barrel protein [Opitutus sp. ER46]|uniref:outer membrane beta-barrel protein n=1 Tax=Opitutus sp. ER46 TaxID=2161864 RepID=UPI000D320AFF|nr:outer membrane beta-barrel protein [Opitutus sp. ER46]PTY01223.1 hypothetical protein DB354_00255 [Opitutus sp. ER46]